MFVSRSPTAFSPAAQPEPLPLTSMAILLPISLFVGPYSSHCPHVARASNDTPVVPHTFSIFGSKLNSGEIKHAHLKLWIDFRINKGLTMKASREPMGLTQDLRNKKLETVTETECRSDLFENMKHRFLIFKKHNYMKNLEHYEQLANGQVPKKGPSETNAALEFAVNTLNVENILVIGQSCCGGIRALMSMEDEAESSGFIQNWVVLGRNARLKTKAVASNLSFDQQCKHCEKESINRSVLNLLTYPWIEEKIREGVLSLHGGYYDFVDCTFEKWTLDYKECSLKEGDERISVKDQSFWG